PRFARCQYPQKSTLRLFRIARETTRSTWLPWGHDDDLRATHFPEQSEANTAQKDDDGSRFLLVHRNSRAQSGTGTPNLRGSSARLNRANVGTGADYAAMSNATIARDLIRYPQVSRDRISGRLERRHPAHRARFAD